MKRIFIILCLITICNISYADIASTGYVDSVVAGKQDSITDIETIRSGAGLGATAVQPSSLSTVATSGSYADLSGKPTLATVATSGSYNDLSNKPTIPTVPTNISSFTNDSGYITNAYHDSTKQDKLPNVPGNNGKYKLVWNSNTGQLGWEFEQFSLTCPSGTYDIGFSQCIDPGPNGTGWGFMGDSTGDWGANSYNTATYGLTTDQTWAAEFSYGIIKGIASCNDTPGSWATLTNQNFSQTDKGQYCWCKMTSPATSSWVAFDDNGIAAACASSCANNCGVFVQFDSGLRSGVFSSVGQ